MLGPTNTGKTHLAVERMLGHASGMIGLPLRLLAREIYDRIVKLRGARAVALITGEEKIVPPRPHYFVCTVEAMPLSREVEFLAVDEIQLCADPERGHVFTHRLLHARGTAETMLLGAGTMGPLVRRLLLHFADTAPFVVAALREKHQARLPEEIWRLAHGLRSSATALGARQLSVRLSDIEKTARTQSLETLEPMLALLERDLDVALKSMNSLIGEFDARAR